MDGSRLAIVLIFLLFTPLLVVQEVRAEKILHNLNLAFPVLLSSGEGGTGSGFFIRNDKGVYLVTAKHVIYKDKVSDDGSTHLRYNKITLTYYSDAENYTEKQVMSLDLNELDASSNILSDSINDISAIKLYYKKNVFDNNLYFNPGIKIVDDGFAAKSQSAAATFKGGYRSFKDDMISNEVYIFGYPTSIGFRAAKQIEQDKPLIRRGVVAGKNNITNRIIIDCPIFPGNSGGPVLMIEDRPGVKKFLLIGMVDQFVPLIETFVNDVYDYKNHSVSNSGYTVVVPMDFIIDLIAKF